MPRYPNILCRVSNIKPQFVQRYVGWLPKTKMSVADFYNYVERYDKTFKNNTRQVSLQWGLYYEENGMCYPRFDHNITEEEASAYIQRWLQNLVVPNPYCRLSQLPQAQNLVVLLVEYMKTHPDIHFLHDIVNGACKERINSSLDILKNTLELTGLFEFRKGDLRFYRISQKNSSANEIKKLNNKNELVPLVNYFVKGPNESEELDVVTNFVYGHPVPYDTLKRIDNINKVLLLEPVNNIIVDLVPNYFEKYKQYKNMNASEYFHLFDDNTNKATPIPPSTDDVELDTQEYSYISAIKTKPFLILGGFSGTGKSVEVKALAFATCPCDGVLNVSETSPGNYLLLSVKPNWHDATDITGFRSTVQNKYYVTDFMRFLLKAKMYEDKNVPFFVCLDEMNLAPVEEYFADFLSVIESRKRKANGKIVTDPIVPASVFNEKYAADYNIFIDMGLKPVAEGLSADEIEANEQNGQTENFVRQDIVDELKAEGLTMPQNVVIIGTVNMDDTTNTFSRKVIDRAMTFETIVGKFGEEYFDGDITLNYIKKPRNGKLFISDEVRAIEAMNEERFELSDDDKQKVLDFINNINEDLDGTPFKISYRILNETILLYRAKQEIEEIMEDDGGFEEDVVFNTDLNHVFDEILMQKVLPRIEGDYEKCHECLDKMLNRCQKEGWTQSEEKIEFMRKRFGTDQSGFTSFWN